MSKNKAMNDELHKVENTQSYSGSQQYQIHNEQYTVRISKPAASVSIKELYRSLERNRIMLDNSFEAMVAAYESRIIKRDDERNIDFRSPTQNALVARTNIDILIPLINIKGGEATYQGRLEGLTIERHIEKLHNKAKERIQQTANKRSFTSGLVLAIFILATIVFVNMLAFN